MENQKPKPEDVFEKIQRTISRSIQAEDGEAVFSCYKIPIIKQKAIKAKAKEENETLKNARNRKKITPRKLPFFSKERIYERDLKIAAVDES